MCLKFRFFHLQVAVARHGFAVETGIENLRKGPFPRHAQLLGAARFILDPALQSGRNGVRQPHLDQRDRMADAGDFAAQAGQRVADLGFGVRVWPGQPHRVLGQCRASEDAGLAGAHKGRH
jgi:hypothetical protein